MVKLNTNILHKNSKLESTSSLRIIDPLLGKKIILGITGCISAYKSCLLIRELVKRGAEVRIVATPAALEFITPLTLSTLSKNDVIVDTFPKNQYSGVKMTTWHIDYGIWADLMLIAPASVNTVAKIASGFCDNALTTLVAALRSPLLICPTADVDMYESPITRANIEKLKHFGFHILEAEKGELASGLSGEGRFPDIFKIIDKVESVLSGFSNDFLGRKILITAGPTFEDIDPVRFIGNRSSGKMGYALAKAAFLRGADVTLISGPSSQASYQEINLIKVRTAAEMKATVDNNISDKDALIMSAAVADYKPQNYFEKKIKKEDSINQINLEKNPDILKSLQNKSAKVIGFALETDNEIANAKHKLDKKNLDLIVLNSLQKDGSGFEVDTNAITVIGKNDYLKEYLLQSKFQTANSILDEVKRIL